MTGVFLNLGAGRKLMGARAFGEFSGEASDYVVINTDISDHRDEREKADSSIVFRQASADSLWLQDEAVDIVFAISPYGYYPLNKEVHRVLKDDGVVVVVGQAQNKYYKKPFDPQWDGAQASFVKLEFFPPVIKNIILKMGSQTTHGHAINPDTMNFDAYMKK